MSKDTTPTKTTTTETTAPVIDASTRLPDDHPLVKAYASTKSELAEARQKASAAENETKTEAEKTAERIAALEKSNSEMAAERLRAEVAKAKSDPSKGIYIPEELLHGSTKEELERAADALLPHLKPSQGVTLPGNQRAGGPTTQVQEQTESKEDRRKRLASEL